MPGCWRGVSLVVLLGWVLAACGADEGLPRATPSAPTATATAPSLTPAPTQPGIVATLSPPAGRLAPDVATGQMLFEQVRVAPDPATGRCSLRANVTNTGSTFLNDVAFIWRIADGAGATLDGGASSIPALAPSETTSIVVTGVVTYTDDWATVEITSADAP